MNKKSSWFSDFARKAARAAGQPVVFALAAAVILVWLVTGPLFGFSDTWQLIVNTGTTIITFLMVFLIQNTQNRDSEAMHIKMDELIRAIEGAHNALLNLEDLSEEELDKIRASYIKLAKEAREALLEKRAEISKKRRSCRVNQEAGIQAHPFQLFRPVTSSCPRCLLTGSFLPDSANYVLATLAARLSAAGWWLGFFVFSAVVMKPLTNPRA